MIGASHVDGVLTLTLCSARIWNPNTEARRCCAGGKATDFSRSRAASLISPITRTKRYCAARGFLLWACLVATLEAVHGRLGAHTLFAQAELDELYEVFQSTAAAGASLGDRLFTFFGDLDLELTPGVIAQILRKVDLRADSAPEVPAGLRLYGRTR